MKIEWIFSLHLFEPSTCNQRTQRQPILASEFYCSRYLIHSSLPQMLRNLVSNPKRTLMHSHCSPPFIDSFEWNLPLGVGISVGHSIVLSVGRRIRDRINGKFAESQSDPNYIQIFDWSVRRCCSRHREISLENV